MKIIRVAFVIAALVGVFTAQATFATHWTSVTQVDKSVSQNCVGGTKIDSPVSGTAYPVSFDGSAGTIPFTIVSTAAGDTLSFMTDDPSHQVDSIIVKGGPTYGLLYTYAGGTYSDTGLHAVRNASSGKWYGVSHVCVYNTHKKSL